MYWGPDEAAHAPKSISSESSLRRGCPMLAACSTVAASASELSAVSAASWPGSKAAGWKLSEKQVPRRCSCLAPASCRKAQLYETCKYCQSTSKTSAVVLQNPVMHKQCQPRTMSWQLFARSIARSTLGRHPSLICWECRSVQQRHPTCAIPASWVTYRQNATGDI